MTRNALRSFVCPILFFSVFFAAQAEEGVDTKYFPPAGDAKAVALVLLGGSEGGIPQYYDTDGLTKQGYACLAVGYFGTKNTPDRLEMIPLEYFESVFES